MYLSIVNPVKSGTTAGKTGKHKAQMTMVPNNLIEPGAITGQKHKSSQRMATTSQAVNQSKKGESGLTDKYEILESDQHEVKRQRKTNEALHRTGKSLSSRKKLRG